MIPDLGFALVFASFAASVLALGASIYGLKTKDSRWTAVAQNALVALFPLVLLACLVLIYLMWTNDFSVAYVVQVTTIRSPHYLKITALWGSQSGSLLFWNLLLAGFTALSIWRNRRNNRANMPYAVLVASFTPLFFLFLSTFIENPFERLEVVPLDGQGLNPLLRHPGMIIHPPMLYLGFVGFTVPFNFAMAALMSGKVEEHWIGLTRRWTLVAWLFLSLGLILGGRWAYDVLGWGGYWGWDPVENASLLPWLAGTAFLHSVMIQEKRGMFKSWNIILVTATYLLVVLATFSVRSGLVSSVHTFAQSSIGWFFFGFLAFMLLFSLYWVMRRWDKLGSEHKLDSLLSREAAFLLNNFIILAILVATLVGIYLPVFSDFLVGYKMTVGTPYYEWVNGLLFAALILLMGVAPLTMWHRTSAKRLGIVLRWPALFTSFLIVIFVVLGVRSVWALLGLWVTFFSAELTLLEFHKGAMARRKRGENYLIALWQLFKRNQRRYGGYLIHLGVLIMAFGVIGIEFFQQQTQIRLQTGESLTIGRYRVEFQGVKRFPGADDLLITEGSADLYLGDKLVTTLHPRIEMYQRTGQPMTIPSMRSTPLEDLYMLMVNWEGVEENAATVRVYINPLINWIWFGGVVFVIGTLVATRRMAEVEAVSVPSRVPAVGD